MTALVLALVLSHAAGAAPPPPTQAKASASSSEDDRNAAPAALEIASSKLGGLAAAGQIQQSKLAASRKLLELQNLASPLEAAFSAAKIASDAEAAGVEVELSSSRATQMPVSAALLALFDRLKVSPGQEEREAISAFERLPAARKQSLANFIGSFLTFEQAAGDAFANLDRAKADELREKAGRVFEQISRPINNPEDLTAQELESMAADLPEWAGSPAQIMQALKIDLAPLLSARAALLDATRALGAAFSGTQAAGSGQGATAMRLAAADPTLCVAGVVCIDLASQDNLYSSNYAVQIDLGGNDTYHNAAGGSKAGGSAAGAAAGAGALVDLGGNDAYGNPDSRLDNGVNGGGFLGAGFLADLSGSDRYFGGKLGVNGAGNNGSGFVLDVSGDDVYDALTVANAGASGGTGMLIDGYGNDRYIVVGQGPPNFAGNNGSGSLGVGSLVDLSGIDLYGNADNNHSAVFNNVPLNGSTFLGSGFLFDGGGPDHYHASSGGLSNGSSAFGYSFLFDASGNDQYHGRNAASFGNLGVVSSAVLIDGTGNDSYHSDTTGNAYSIFGLAQPVSHSPALLVDGAGNDSYIVTGAFAHTGRGNGYGLWGQAALIDAGTGHDYFQDKDLPGGSCFNCTILPKPESLVGYGAQIDGFAGDPRVNSLAGPRTDAPRNLEIIPRDRRLDISWDEPPNAVGHGAQGGPVYQYTVYRSTSPGSEGKQPVGTVPDVSFDKHTRQKFADTAVENGTTYYYTVTAHNPGGESPHSTEISATPQAPVFRPTDPLPTARPGDGKVDLLWAAPYDDGGRPVTGYNVYRSTTPGGQGTTPLATGVASTGYTDFSVVNGTRYYYTVSAVNSVGEGPQSVEVSATPATSPAVPSAPTGLSAQPGDARVSLSWNAPASGPVAATYNIYRSTTSGGQTGGPMATEVEATSFTDSTAQNRTRYFYRVSAVNPDGEGAFSNEASATPAPLVPDPNTLPAPTSLLSIEDSIDTEGSTGATKGFVFNVTLTPARPGVVAVKYQVSRGTTANDDYIVPGPSDDTTILFAPGETRKTVTVPVKADFDPERDEFFQVFLKDNTNSLLAKRQAIGVIRDDDGGNAPPAIVISDVVQNEGSAGATSNFDFKVTLAAPSGNRPVSVNYTTGNGTAHTSDNDYVAVSGTLSFAPGETEKFITVQVKGDSTYERSEFFQVFLSNAVNAATAKSQAVGVIVHDDGKPVTFL